MNAQATDTGRVQLYELGDSGDSWPLTSSRSPPDAVGSESFGAALAILDAPGSNPDRLFIGAPTTTVDGQAVAGRVHHYRSTAEDWEPVEIMNLFAPELLDWYGCALAVSGEYLFIGMRGRSKPGSDAKGGGIEVQRIAEVGVYLPVDSLFPLNEESGARFGAALALGNGDGPRLIVGAPGEDSDVFGTVIEDAGRAYSFDAVPSGDDYEWLQTNSLGIRGDPVANDQLGYSVAVTGDGDTAFAGAPFRVFGAGRVQVYVGDAIFIDGFNPVE